MRFLILALALSCQPQLGPPAAYSETLVEENLVQNAGFEHDWVHSELTHQKRFLLLHASDLGLAESDGKPDYWTLSGGFAWDPTVAHGGSRSLRCEGAGEAFHRIRFASETSPKSGGAHYAAALPMEERLARHLPKRPIVVRAWARWDSTPPELAVEVDCRVRKDGQEVVQGTSTRTVAFAGQPGVWSSQELRIEPEGTPYFVKVRLVGKGGKVWFDDVSCQEPQAGGTVVAQFGNPQPWTWMRTPYYAWTGWSHKASSRADFAEDKLAGALRLAARPGDSFSVSASPIALNQNGAHPIEVRAQLLTDNLRGFEIMAQDESGQWLPQGDFTGDDVETDPTLYDMGSTGLGTHGWIGVRKYFSPSRPVKSLKIFLCLRGFDSRNRVGTAWIHSVRVVSHGDRNPEAQLHTSPLAELDLGDRLWGNNLLRFRSSTKGSYQLKLGGRSFPGRANGEWVEIPYRIERLCSSWKEQIQAEVVRDGQVVSTLWMGTPAAKVETGVESYYLYPEEKQLAWARLNVARGSLGEVGALSVGPAHETDLARLWLPRTGPKYLDTQRLLLAEIPKGGATAHPWSEPMRDQKLQAALGQDRYPLPAYGFLTRLPASDLPSEVKSTRVNARNYLEVNGKPYFPVFWAPHLGTLPEVNYPPRMFGLKSADLTEAVYQGKPLGVEALKSDPTFFQYELGEGEMALQDDGWRDRLARLVKAIAQIRAADPNHVINGPESWLIGHPEWRTVMQAFAPHWDVIGVETSREEFPVAARGARPCAVLAGLEAYYTQPLEVLRWRGYQSVIHGCGGVGLCPSAMLEARPPMINFLRGLNAEFRALAPVITGAEAAKLVLKAPAGVDWMAREHAGKVYLIAAASQAVPQAQFVLGGNLTRARAMFEDRPVKLDRATLSDSFPTQYTVRVYELSR